MTIGLKDALARFATHRLALAALIFLCVATSLSLAAPLLFDHDAFAMIGEPFIWPGTDRRFPLGTDMFGRDILAGLVYGARVSLAIGAAAALLSSMIGIVIGLLAGYFGSWVDAVLMRITELFQTVPSIIFVITIVVVLQPSIMSVLLAIGLTSWPQTARLIRAEALKLRNSEFVAAAFTLGFSSPRILIGHILPNAVSPAIVTGTILAGTAILTESALAFLGLTDPNIMSWGSMIGAGRQVLRTAWYITAIPGLAIVFTVLAISAVGEGLNHVFNKTAT